MRWIHRYRHDQQVAFSPLVVFQVHLYYFRANLICIDVRTYQFLLFSYVDSIFIQFPIYFNKMKQFSKKMVCRMLVLRLLVSGQRAENIFFKLDSRLFYHIRRQMNYVSSAHMGQSATISSSTASSVHAPTHLEAQASSKLRTAEVGSPTISSQTLQQHKLIDSSLPNSNSNKEFEESSSHTELKATSNSSTESNIFTMKESSGVKLGKPYLDDPCNPEKAGNKEFHKNSRRSKVTSNTDSARTKAEAPFNSANAKMVASAGRRNNSSMVQLRTDSETETTDGRKVELALSPSRQFPAIPPLQLPISASKTLSICADELNNVAVYLLFQKKLLLVSLLCFAANTALFIFCTFLMILRSIRYYHRPPGLGNRFLSLKLQARS